METTTATRQNAVSLAEVISNAKEAHKAGKELDKCIQLLWRRMYETVPALDYSIEEQKMRDNRRIKGNPDVCNALAKVLVSQGVPDCLEAHRLAMPIFWIMSGHEALIAMQRDQGKDSCYLWHPVKRKYRRMKGAYAKAFGEHLPYLRANLRIALGCEQKL
jgi:hypothetical protein